MCPRYEYGPATPLSVFRPEQTEALIVSEGFQRRSPSHPRSMCEPRGKLLDSYDVEARPFVEGQGELEKIELGEEHLPVNRVDVRPSFFCFAEDEGQDGRFTVKLEAANLSGDSSVFERPFSNTPVLSC